MRKVHRDHQQGEGIAEAVAQPTLGQKSSSGTRRHFACSNVRAHRYTITHPPNAPKRQALAFSTSRCLQEQRVCGS